MLSWDGLIQATTSRQPLFNAAGGVPSAGTTGQAGNFDVAACILYDRYLSDDEMSQGFVYLASGNAQ
jgi:hypothetical protein